jgi:DNA-binding transcriptional LysR family regulator
MTEEIPPVDIELRTWRQFLVLSQTLHFGRAAQRLHMTQPPLTLAIQQLERRLGTVLFERNRRSVALTAAGNALLEPARQLVSQAAALSRRAREAADGEVGRIRLGFVSTVAFGLLPGWLRAFREAHPGIAMELREATGDVQFDAFARRELDVGFVLHVPGIVLPVPLERLSLGDEPLLLALPDPPARRISSASLLHEPLIIFPRPIAPSLYDAVLAFYHRHGVTPTIAQEAIQMQTIVNLVSAGLGIALVPRSMRTLQRPGVRYRALPAALAEGAPRSETSLVWSPDAAPAVRRFVEFVRATVGSTPASRPASGSGIRRSRPREEQGVP